MDDLGQLISEHKPNETATGSTLVVGLICFAMSAVMVIVAANQKFGSFDQILFGFAGLAALAGGIGSVQSYRRNRGGKVDVYQNGLIAEKGGRRHTARWDEIAVIYESVEKIYLNGSYIYDRYLYTIEKTSGETFTLSNMASNIEQLGQVLKARTLELLYPQAKEKIGRGEQVHFDSLAVDQTGLSGIPWTEIAAFKLREGIIEVTDKKGKTVVSGDYAATPNAHLLIELLNERLPRTE